MHLLESTCPWVMTLISANPDTRYEGHVRDGFDDGRRGKSMRDSGGNGGWPACDDHAPWAGERCATRVSSTIVREPRVARILVDIGDNQWCKQVGLHPWIQT
jgi:hypothetical protein